MILSVWSVYICYIYYMPGVKSPILVFAFYLLLLCSSIPALLLVIFNITFNFSADSLPIHFCMCVCMYACDCSKDFNIQLDIITEKYLYNILIILQAMPEP